ncbi:uncharacterized protein LOC128551175 [Mercenaria mercenaria]|uniref:uncharacterized protein LOC128551175 n=1 Tax=Mercenaria mercenaria TaxID=6596 RepID=UPI00234F5098|nr:uncharacterized protein LOC128551175 [Mercenaria mercenaria]
MQAGLPSQNMKSLMSQTIPMMIAKSGAQRSVLKRSLKVKNLLTCLLILFVPQPLKAGSADRPWTSSPWESAPSIATSSVKSSATDAGNWGILQTDVPVDIQNPSAMPDRDQWLPQIQHSQVIPNLPPNSKPDDFSTDDKTF